MAQIPTMSMTNEAETRRRRSAASKAGGSGNAIERKNGSPGQRCDIDDQLFLGRERRKAWEVDVAGMMLGRLVVSVCVLLFVG